MTDQAYDNYNSVKGRIESIFLKKGGRLPAHMWLVSSKSNESGWLQQHLDTARDDPKSRVFDNPIWDIVKHKQKGFFSGKKFTLFIGDKYERSFYH